jgi:predicted nucleic acid-binding protein
VVLEDLGFEPVAARNAISSLLRQPLQFVETDAGTVLDAYDISAAKNHDVYDCFYLALARAVDADVLLTTDRNFESLCTDEPFDYLNPVPGDVLSEFDGAGE